MRLSTVHFISALIFAGLALGQGVFGRAKAADLKPFKDALFSAQTVLQTDDNGDYQAIDYQKSRDLEGRDQIAERRVKAAYVSTDITPFVKDAYLDVPQAGRLELSFIGQLDNAAFTVIFVHGQGGDRRLAMDDYRFGGNFNRLKNLVYENGGVYYAPTLRSFDEAGMSQIAALIEMVSRRSPGKPIVLSCASMGSFICWGLTRNQKIVERLSGMLIMGGALDPNFQQSIAFKKKLRIWFSHGSLDNVYPAGDQIMFYQRLHRAKYPTRFTLFVSGSHGTPLRMTDWKAALNWLMP